MMLDYCSIPPSQFVHVNMPLQDLTPYLTVSTLRKIAKSHGCLTGSHDNKKTLQYSLENHSCPQCNVLVTVFSIELPKLKQQHEANLKKKKHEDSNGINTLKEQLDSSNIATDSLSQFPPEPLTSAFARNIVDGACKKMTKNKIEEGGCAVCGELVPIGELSRLKAIKNHLHILKAEGVSSVEQKNLDQKKKEYTGPILDYKHSNVCNTCRMSIRCNKVPRLALAHGLWLGDVPEELSSLQFVEKLLIARVRHTCCFLKISTGGHKMKANAIAFETPIPKVYSKLPPPRDEMDDVLAIFFTGPCKPTLEDYNRSLVLV